MGLNVSEHGSTAETLELFIQMVSHSYKEDAAICTAIISLAKSLNLQLVAEGVETESQLHFLKEMKCDLYQGYLFSRPLSVAEVHPLLLEFSS